MIDKTQSLHEAHRWERRVAEVYRQQGYCVLETYKFSTGEQQAPLLLVPHDRDYLIVPDLIVFGQEGTRWVEVKTKSSRTREGMTGFDLEKYLNYLKLKSITGIGVDIIFVQKDERAAYRVSLSKLMKLNHKLSERNIILWRLADLEQIGDILPDESISGTIAYRRDSESVSYGTTRSGIRFD